MVRLYHADAELERVLDGLTIGALAMIAIPAAFLVVRAPTGARGRLLATTALIIAVVGIAAHLALQFMQDEVWDTGRRLQVAVVLFFVRMASFFLAAPLALTAFFRGEGRLAGLALALSLVLPTLFVVWMLACGVTDACFH